MQHITLTKIHGYIAVFFFPMAILYAITGTAYIVGEGGEAIRTTYEFPQQTQWPTDVDQARLLAATLLEQENLPPPSTIMGQRVLGDNGYSWRGFTHGVTLNRDENQQITIVFQKNSLYRQLVEIHKDHAGSLFSILGFGFGIGMFILVLSGAYMMIQSKGLRKQALVLVSLGTTATLVSYFITINS